MKSTEIGKFFTQDGESVTVVEETRYNAGHSSSLDGYASNAELQLEGGACRGVVVLVHADGTRRSSGDYDTVYLSRIQDSAEFEFFGTTLLKKQPHKYQASQWLPCGAEINPTRRTESGVELRWAQAYRPIEEAAAKAAEAKAEAAAAKAAEAAEAAAKRARSPFACLLAL